MSRLLQDDDLALDGGANPINPNNTDSVNTNDDARDSTAMPMLSPDRGRALPVDTPVTPPSRRPEDLNSDHSPRVEPKTPLLSPEGTGLRNRRADKENKDDNDNKGSGDNEGKGNDADTQSQRPSSKKAAGDIFAAAASLVSESAKQGKAAPGTGAAGSTEDGFSTPNIRRQRRQSVGTALRGHIRRTLRAVQVKQAHLMRKATEIVFPEAKTLPTQRPRITGAEVESSLPLQVLLYYNSFFSVFWFVLHILFGAWKRANLEIPLAFAVMDPLVLFLWIINEPVRLLFAWTGNLEEKVPQLGTWWLLTLFPTLECNLYFFAVQPNLMPLDRALNFVSVILVVIELVVGFFAIKRLIKSQTTRFYLAELGDPVDPISAEHAGNNPPGIDNTLTQPLPPIPRA